MSSITESCPRFSEYVKPGVGAWGGEGEGIWGGCSLEGVSKWWSSAGPSLSEYI